MGYVEVFYKDHSGLRLEQGKISDMSWDYCGTCRSITESENGGSYELGTFICHVCLGTPNGFSTP
jgi:hypothetical protein